MRIWILVFGLILGLPQLIMAEVWDFSCTEAVSLLKAAQDRVVQKHETTTTRREGCAVVEGLTGDSFIV